MIEELALLAEKTNNDAVRLGAIRARAAATAERHELLRLSGLLPATPRAASLEAELVWVQQALVAVLEKHDLPDEVLDDFEAALLPPALASTA